MFDKPFRLHFSSVIENTLSVCWVIIVLIITNFLGLSEEMGAIGNKEAIMAILVLFGLIAIIFIINFIRWRKTFIILDQDTLIIQRKLFMSNKTTIGIKNIAAVNLEQNLLQRIFGTYKIKLDTNSLTTANQTDVKIVLRKDLAIELQKRIIEMLNNDTKIVEEQEKYDIEYDFGEVISHSILSIPVFAILYAVIVIIMLGLGFQSEDAGEAILGNTLQSILSILLIIIPAVFTMIKAVFRLYNFKVKRIDDKVYIKYGLITTKKYTIPIDKINAIVVKQPVLARIFRRYTVELINVGMGETQEESPVLFLMGTKEEIIQKMQKILPEINIEEQTEPQPKKSIIPITIKVIIWAIIFIIPSIVVLPYIAISIAAFALLVGILMYRTRRLGIYDEYIKIVNGIFERKFTIIEYEKIQHIELQRSILTEKLGIEKSNVYILAEMSKVRHYTGYFGEEKFEKIADKILRKG